MKKLTIIFLSLIFATNPFSQEKVEVLILDTLKIRGINSIVYINNSVDSIYVYTSVYTSTGSKLLIKNLLDEKQRRNNSNVLTLKKIMPNTSVNFNVTGKHFLSLKRNNIYVLLRTKFYTKKYGKKSLVKEIEKRVFLQ